jgi:uncharacterized membrane protein YoaK (UPF0700 family)
VMTVRLGAHRLRQLKVPVVRPLLALKVVLLAAAAAIIIGLGPFGDADNLLAIIAGLMLVAAMAIQNAIQRVHMASLPPTTIMTGNSTQLMLDVADYFWAHGDPTLRDIVRTRLGNLSRAVLSFAGGCALAALAMDHAGDWCFVLPPFIAAVTVWQRLEGPGK